VEDVRDYLKSRIALRKCLEIGEDEFMSIGVKKGGKKA
jgi:hypothetical protein